MSKHTPGPWRKVGGMLVGSDECEVVAAGLGLGLGQDNGSGNRTANARLIAAAPELLLMCEKALFIVRNEYPALAGELSAAISKATGEKA